MTYLGFIHKEKGYTITTNPRQDGTPVDRKEFATALLDMVRIYERAPKPLRDPVTIGLSVAESGFVEGLHELLNGVKKVGGIHAIIPSGGVLEQMLKSAEEEVNV